MALTFMAKYDEREGNSCHIHISLRGTTTATAVFAGDGPARLLAAVRALPRRPAGVPARADLPVRAERQLLQAVRRRAASPRRRSAWGLDNRTCSLRVVGHGAGLRVENRVPGGDVNPYLAVAAADRGRAARHRAGAAAAAGADGQRLRRRRPARAVRPCATRPTLSPRRRWRPRRSARRWSSTTPTPPASSSPRSTRPSPTGSGGAGSSACERRPLIGLTAYGEQAALGRVGAARRCCSRARYTDAVVAAGGLPVLLPRRGSESAAVGRPARRGGARRRPRRRPGPLRRRGRTRAPALPRTERDAAELAVLRAGAGPGRPGARRVPRRCSCSTSRSAARCASTCPTSSGTTGHNPRPGVFGTHRRRAGPGSPGGAALGARRRRAVPPPPGDRPARRRPRGHRPGRATAPSRPSSWPGRAFVARRAVAPRAGRSRGCSPRWWRRVQRTA